LNKPETANSNAQIQLHPVLKRAKANTKSDQVLHLILTELAPSLQVTDLQVVGGSALLAAPSVTIQHL